MNGENSRRLVGAAAAALLLAACSSDSGGARMATVERVPVGNEPQQAHCYYSRGFNVCEPFKDFYLKHQEHLGLPVGSFNFAQSRQCFMYACLKFNPAKEPAWQVELENLGTQAYQLTGKQPQPGSTIDPALRQALLAMQEQGLEINRLVGSVVSPPIRSREGVTYQFAEKVGFQITQRDEGSAVVELLPLGLNASPLPEPVRGDKPLWEQVGVWPLAAALLLVGSVLVLLQRARGGSRVGGRTI